ncbi:MAG: MBL fold metallo-hydrolase [Ignavibacteria bacterium]
MVIITPTGLVVIDTRTDTKNALSEIAEIKKLTSLPVKYIINTHWHYDHILGNGEFKKEWPDAVIIAHKDCLKQMEENVPQALALEPGASIDIITQFKKELSSGIGGDGNPLSDYDKLRHKETIADVEEYINYPIPKYVPPDITFDSMVTIYQGGMEIQISRWGNGHTIGDAMVWIPALKILITGDNVVAPVPYSLGNYVKGQINILERIKSLDVNVIIPGHGPVQYDKKYISCVISMFIFAEARVNECYSKGMTVDESIKSVSFDDFLPLFVTGNESAYAFKNYFAVPVIRAIYKNELGVK